MVTLNEACNKTLELFRKRPGALNWADNIEEGSRGLRDEDYENYIRFLAMPSRLKANHPEVKSQESDLPKLQEQFENAVLDDHMKVEVKQNGPDQIIHVRNTRFITGNDTDESSDEKESNIWFIRNKNNNGEQMAFIFGRLQKKASK